MEDLRKNELKNVFKKNVFKPKNDACYALTKKQASPYPPTVCLNWAQKAVQWTYESILRSENTKPKRGRITPLAQATEAIGNNAIINKSRGLIPVCHRAKEIHKPKA